MTEEMDNTAILRPRRALGYILGMTLLSVLVASWFIWGPFGVIFYVAGQLGSMGIFVYLLCCLIWLVAAVVICLPVLVVSTVWRWRRLTYSTKWSRLVLMAVVFAFMASVGLGFLRRGPSPFDMFMRGFGGYVERRTQIEAIQNWLSMLDPNDCEGQPLDVRVARSAPAVHPAKSVRTPPSIACLKAADTRLRRDDMDRPMVRLIWGSGHLGWGLVVGDKDMRIPGRHVPGSGRQKMYYEDDGLRRSLAPGAYL